MDWIGVGVNAAIAVTVPQVGIPMLIGTVVGGVIGDIQKEKANKEAQEQIGQIMKDIQPMTQEIGQPMSKEDYKKQIDEIMKGTWQPAGAV